jgi:cell division cycle 2-like
MHAKWFLHRDLKTSNILVQHQTGRVALADFGLARRFQEPARAMTQLVVTLWYRAPELLFGETCYGPGVDMWSIGCIFGELISKEAILQGQGELDQIDHIFSLLGVPNESTWPSFDKLPNAGLFRWKPKSKAEILLPVRFPVAKPVAGKQAFLDCAGYDLLAGLLTLDPSKRLTAQQASDHPYFRTGVAPQRPHCFSLS